MVRKDGKLDLIQTGQELSFKRALNWRYDSSTSTLTPARLPSFHNHPQALIRMWRTLRRTCSRAHVCYAPVYPRGRIAGGQDLAGQCTTLSSPHGSLLWTFTGWQCSGKLSQKAYSCRNHIECIRFECCLCFFSALPAQSGIKAVPSTPGL